MVDLICSYMEKVSTYPVKPDVQPGQLRAQFPAAPPAQPQPWEEVKQDIQSLIMPGEAPGGDRWPSAVDMCAAVG